MSASRGTQLGTATDLRLAFDGTFALLPTTKLEGLERFLAMGVAGKAYALRMTEVTGLAAGRKIVALPGVMPELLGLAGVRGQVIPVYSLASWLGQERDREGPSWFAICGATDPVGLAFTVLDGYLELARSAVYPARSTGGQPMSHHTGDVLRTADGARSIIHVASIVETIRGRIRAAGTIKEG